MKKEQINKYCKAAHQNAIDKGFYDCNICDGEGLMDQGDCPSCKGTGIDQNRNIGELLMLIVSELGEALEAHRKNRFTGDLSKWKEDHLYCLDPEKNPQFEHDFKRNIKDSFEDEIADVFIRLFDLCGYLEIDLPKIEIEQHLIKWNSNNIADALYRLTSIIGKIRHYEKSKFRQYMVFHFFAHLIDFCKWQEIDIQKHIYLKMAYNKTRPRKHGKEY